MADLSPIDRAIRAARRGHAEAARRLFDAVLEGEPENETALSWRARITDDPGAKSTLLRRALAVNPDNKWAAGALEGLGNAEAGAVPSSRSLDSVGARAAAIDNLQCPNCAGQVEIHPDRGPKSVVCTHCGSVLDLTSKQLEILGQVRTSFKPAHGIFPGAEAVFEGEKHLVSGWLRYKGWDDEESWTWDEWQLISDGGQIRYLSYSRDEGFVLQTPIRPTPKVTRRGAELPGGNVSFHEVGPAKISGMAGELTWRPKLDQTLQVAEGRRGSLHYSAEMTADEIEVVGGPRLPDLEVWKALGRDDLVKAAEAKGERARRRRQRARSYARLFFAAALFFGVLAWWLVPTMGSNITEAAVTYTAEPAVVPSEADGRAARIVVLHDTVEVGKIQLEPGRAYRADVRITSPVAPPLGVDVDVAFVGPGGSPVYRTPVPILTGPEGSEVEVTTKPFSVGVHSYGGRAPTAPGNSYQMVYLVEREWRGRGDRARTESVTFPIAVEIRSVWMPGPFWFAMVFSLFLSFVFFVFSRTGPR